MYMLLVLRQATGFILKRGGSLRNFSNFHFSYMYLQCILLRDRNVYPKYKFKRIELINESRAFLIKQNRNPMMSIISKSLFVNALMSSN